MNQHFRTTFPVVPPHYGLTYQSKLALLGSCFSDHIGGLLADHKFAVRYNPFGVLFNPVSLVTLLKRVRSTSGSLQDWNTHFVERDGCWFHFFLHSKQFAASKQALAEQLEKEFQHFQAFLNQANVLFLTLGTAWVYEWKQTETIVANCHKLPQQQFTKRLLSVEEVEASLLEISAMFPSLKVVLTVSPVRHIKDGIPENSVSKAVLRLACHKWVGQCPNGYYFPAYELLNDDLRDYRFYADDLIHPNTQAIGYVWEHFCAAFMTTETRQRMALWKKLKSQLEHRPLQAGTPAHQKFLHSLSEALSSLPPEIDVAAELSDVRLQLANFAR